MDFFFFFLDLLIVLYLFWEGVLENFFCFLLLSFCFIFCIFFLPFFPLFPSLPFPFLCVCVCAGQLGNCYLFIHGCFRVCVCVCVAVIVGVVVKVVHVSLFMIN